MRFHGFIPLRKDRENLSGHLRTLMLTIFRRSKSILPNPRALNASVSLPMLQQAQCESSACQLSVSRTLSGPPSGLNFRVSILPQIEEILVRGFNPSHLFCADFSGGIVTAVLAK